MIGHGPRMKIFEKGHPAHVSNPSGFPPSQSPTFRCVASRNCRPGIPPKQTTGYQTRQSNTRSKPVISQEQNKYACVSSHQVFFPNGRQTSLIFLISFPVSRAFFPVKSLGNSCVGHCFICGKSIRDTNNTCSFALFPCFFPVKQGKKTETGSLWTASTTTISFQFRSCAQASCGDRRMYLQCRKGPHQTGKGPFISDG